MNADILKGSWKELKGTIKQKWGKLTEDELSEVEGREDQFLGLLERKYGLSREQAKKEYEEFMAGREKEDVPRA